VRRQLLRLARFSVDLEPLRRYRDYRLMFWGQMVNELGSEMARVALPYQLYVITHSVASLGVMATVQLVGLLSFSLAGGAIADVMDRKRLILWSQAGLCAISVALAVLAFTQTATDWWLYALSLATGVLMAVDRPTRQAIVPKLVRREAVTPAIALNQVGSKLARIVGPGIGGFLIASLDVSAVYVIDVATFAIAIACMLAMAPIPPEGAASKPGWAAVVEAVQYLKQTPYLLSSLVMDFNAMLFGLPVGIFPVLALDVFHAGPEGLGILAAAQPLGAVIGGLASGWLLRMRYQGRVVIGSVIAWGICMTLLGLSPWFPLAVLFMVLGGIANVTSAVVRGTIVQLTTPNVLRGRVSALSSMITNGGPRLGDLEAAAVAAVAGPQFAVVSGGLLCLAGVAGVMRLFPQLAAYDASGDAVEEADLPVAAAPALALSQR
jgi:MFS family permease